MQGNYLFEDRSESSAIFRKVKNTRKIQRLIYKQKYTWLAGYFVCIQGITISII